MNFLKFFVFFYFLERDDFDVKPEELNIPQTAHETPSEETALPDEPQILEVTTVSSDTGQIPEPENEKPVALPSVNIKEPNPQQKDLLGPRAPSSSARQPFRQKFQRWPNQPPRWNSMNPQHQPPLQFQRGPGPVPRPPGHMMPNRPLRPGFIAQSRPNFFNNNFMQQSRAPHRLPLPRQRFFYPGPGPINEQPMPVNPSYVPSPIIAGGNIGQASTLPMKVLINPNFKGGVEAVKSK